jgi:hypothetical protein
MHQDAKIQYYDVHLFNEIINTIHSNTQTALRPVQKLVYSIQLLLYKTKTCNKDTYKPKA